MDESKIMSVLEELKAYTLLAAKEMLTVEDLSLFTGFKPSYIRKLTQEGKLPFYKPFGKQLFYKKSEIDAILQDKEKRVPSVIELVKQR